MLDRPDLLRVRCDALPRDNMSQVPHTGRANLHSGWSFRRNLRSLWNIWRKWLPCSSTVSKKTMMSSMYTLQNDSSPASTRCISLWKVAGALHSPKGITRNSKSPCWVMKAVFSLELDSIWICQYQLLASSVENTLFPPSWSRRSSTLGIGKTSLRVTSCSPHRI